MYAKMGLRKDLEENEDYLATDRVMTAIGLNAHSYSSLTAEDPESQFWRNVNSTFTLSETGLKSNLAIMITDPNNKMKVEAIMEGRAGYLEEEKTQALGQ